VASTPKSNAILQSERCFGVITRTPHATKFKSAQALHVRPMEDSREERTVEDPSKSKPDSIALLFLTVGEIRNSKIWAAWVKSVNPDHYSIYVHAKVRHSPFPTFFPNFNFMIISESKRCCSSSFCESPNQASQNEMGRY
jgi:hypothetical protein